MPKKKKKKKWKNVYYRLSFADKMRDAYPDWKRADNAILCSAPSVYPAHRAILSSILSYWCRARLAYAIFCYE